MSHPPIPEALLEAVAIMVESDPRLLAAITPQTPDELYEYVRNEYGYTIPRVAVCEGHCSPFQALSDAYFSHGGEMVWVGPRTGGKTLQFALLEHLVMLHFADTVAHAGAIDAQAMKCYEYLRQFFNLEQFRYAVDGVSLLSNTHFKNGASVEVLPMTMSRLNSPHTRLLCITGDARVAVSLGYKRLDKVQVGDQVWSLARADGIWGYSNVTATHDNGVRPVVRVTFTNGVTLDATPDHRVLTDVGWQRLENLIGVMNVTTADRGGWTKIRSLKPIGEAAVFDITVEGTHNYVANGIVVHNCLDEIELTSEKLMSEAQSIPMRVRGRAPLVIYTSSRKHAYGPMENLLETAHAAGREVKKWCVFEIIENCPPERHKEGALSGCGSCQLEEVCRTKVSDPWGNQTYEPGPGKAARSRGWMPIDDVIGKFITMDRGVFDAQWLSLRPETSGLAYPMFDEKIHVIDYEYNAAFPVVCGIDFGYTNPSVALYAQATPSDDVVIFAEDYASGRTADVLAQSMAREPWFENTAWRVADSAAAGDRATLKGFGVHNEPTDKSTSILDLPNLLGGIALMRWALKPSGRTRPILYVSRTCVNFIREIKRYHNPDAKEDRNADERPVKSDDHAMDAARYLMVRLYRGMLNV